MIEKEIDRFRAVLTERVAEVERVTRHRDAITVGRSTDQLDHIHPKRLAAVSQSWKDSSRSSDLL